MSTVKLKRIEPQTVELYEGDTFVGMINEYELNDIRIQIRQTKTAGFWIRWEDKKLDIDIHGRLSEWPTGFFDLQTNQLFQLIR